MSKERSPRELCSTTIGTRGISYSLSIHACRTARREASVSAPSAVPDGAVGESQRSLADLERHDRRAAELERLAQRGEVREEAVAASPGIREHYRLERLSARLGSHP